MNKPINLEAVRARFAFECAEAGNKKQAATKATNEDSNYSAAVQELSSMIRMNGLRATMAYYYSKGGAHKQVFDDVKKWFQKEDQTKMIAAKFVEQGNFMKILLDLTDDEYRIVQAEVLTLANWMIRFVKSPENNNDQNLENQGDGQP